MPENIFNLEKPTKARITLTQEEDNTFDATLGKLTIYEKEEKLIAEGSILVTAELSKKLLDLVSRNTKGLFSIEFYTGKDRVVVQGCTGERSEKFLLGGVMMANVYFKQTCFKVPKSQTINAEKENDFIVCPSSFPSYPELGDLVFDKNTKKMYMYMSDGWTCIDALSKFTKPPRISKTKSIAIPDGCITFSCEPLENRRWDRDINSRRAKKILHIKRKRRPL